MAYRTVLIEENRMMLERLSSVIRNTPGFELSARYQSAGDALGQMQAFNPNLVLLDIDRPQNITLLSDFKKSYPASAIICLSRRWDSDAQARLMRSGAVGYMIKPFTADELTEAVKTFTEMPEHRNSTVITFFSPKGKSGKTTLISNLAAAMADITKDKVAIIDGDLQFGDMSVFFNLTPQTTIVEAARDITFLSPVTLKSYFTDVGDELSILCGPTKPDLSELVTPQSMESLIGMAKTLYRYVLVDLPSGFTDFSATACEASDKTVVMASINGGYEVDHMRRALEIFKAWDDYKTRVWPVFTRVSPCDDNEKEIIAKALGDPIFHILPNDYLLVSSSADNGRLAIHEKPDGAFSESVMEMGEKIVENTSK